MELIINKKTYTLKNVNSARRQFFVDHVFPHYNSSNGNLDEFFLSVQKAAPEKTLENIRLDFFKNFAQVLDLAVWIFLTAEDKKQIGVIGNLDVKKEEFEKFINWVSAKITKYSEYVGSKSSSNKSEEVEPIFCFLAATYGWTFEQMKEMDELDLLRSVEEAINLKKKNQIEQINSNALAGAYASGSKKAKSEIDKLNRKVTTEHNFKNLKKTNPELKATTNFSREDLQKIMNADSEAKNGR